MTIQPIPYISSALRVVVLDWPAEIGGKPRMPPESFWRRQHDGARNLFFRMTPEVLAWVHWKCEKADASWISGNLPAETMEAMRVLAERLPDVWAAAKEFGVTRSAATSAANSGALGKATIPKLPNPPVALSALERGDWSDAPSAYEAWMDKKYRSRAKVDLEAGDR